jgi:ATP-dependent Zn protease
MGGVLSSNVNTSVQSTVSNAVTNAIIKNTSNCTAQNTNAISLQFGTVVGDFNLSNANLTQLVTINSSCLQQTTNNTDIVNDIKTNLLQNYQNTSSGALVSSSVNTQVSNAITNVSNSINIQNIKSCLLNNLTSTTIGANYVGGSVNITNLTVGQVTNLVQTCVQNDTNTVSATNKLETALTSQQTASVSSIIFGVITLIVIILLLYLLFSFGKKKNGNVPKDSLPFQFQEHTNPLYTK